MTTYPLLGLFGLGTWELAIIFLVVLLIFGVGKLPELGGGIGKGIRNFKKELKGGEDDEDQNSKSIPPQNT